MSRLAHAVRSASDDALLNVSLESMAAEMGDTTVSMEQHAEDLETMLTLVHGLEGVVVSVESVGDAPLSYQRHARTQALGFLTMSGLSASEADTIFPSLEAEQPSTAWEKFKAFIARLWKFITEAAKRLFLYVRSLLDKSSIAEKAAMSQLRKLRKELAGITGALTRDPTIKLRPAHRYLFNQEGALSSLADVEQNVNAFIKGRNAVQKTLPDVIAKVAQDLVNAVDALSLHGNAAQVTASIEKNLPALRDAVSPMFPEALASKLGAQDYVIPLIHDREVQISRPVEGHDAAITDEQLASRISQFGIDVSQIQVPSVGGDDLGTFPALRVVEIAKLIKLAETLIDEGYSADQRRTWNKIDGLVRGLAFSVDGVLKTVIKMEELDPAARDALKLILNARHAAAKWASAPYMQLNAVNVRVVNSVLALVADQIQNYELQDTMQERADKEKLERAKQEKKDKK